MNIYLTGKRDDCDYCDNVEKLLASHKHNVVNALKVERDLSGISTEVIRSILDLIIEATDAVMMLSDWQMSEAAKQDFIHAAAIKKNILFEDFNDEELCHG